MRTAHICVVVAGFALLQGTVGPTALSQNAGAPAASYYVSNSGSDSNAGISAVAPWKTLAKLQTTTLHPGDHVYLDCASTFVNQPFTMQDSGSSKNPIVFTDYNSAGGACPQNALLSGGIALTGFTLFNGSTYSRAAASNPTQVFQDGARLTVAASQSAMTAGSWYWDGSTLYVWCTDSAAPSTHAMRDSSNNVVGMVNFNGRGWIDWSNIDITMANHNGFNFQDVSGAHDITISNSTASFDGQRGFSLGGGADLETSNIAFVNDTGHDNLGEAFWIGNGANDGCNGCVAYNNGKDIRLKGYRMDGGGILVGNRAVNCYVENSYIYDTYHNAALRVEFETFSGAVQPTGTRIEFNRITNTAVSLTYVVAEEGSGTLYLGNVIYSEGPVGGDLLRLDSQSGDLAHGSTDDLFYNNTLYVNGSGYADAVNILYARNPTFKNNILARGANNSKGNVISYASPSTGLVSDYNAIPDGWQSVYLGSYGSTLAAWRAHSSQDAHSTNASPSFTDATGLNFTLAAGSAMIGSGLDLGSSYNAALHAANTWPGNAVKGTQKKTWNIGAYLSN